MITINGVKPINDADQWIFLTLTVDGDECKFTHVALADLTGQALQDYVDTNEDSYRLDILKDMYPGAVVVHTENQTILEAFTVWVAAGHKNIIEVNGEQVETVVTKTPWTGTHLSSMVLFGEAGALAAIKKQVREYIHSHFDAEIQCSMSAINQSITATESQKTEIKKVFDWIMDIMVYYYARKVAIKADWEAQWGFSTFDATVPTVSLGDVIALGVI